MDLYSFQKEGIAFALEREASLIADEMGLGKTAQARLDARQPPGKVGGANMLHAKRVRSG
jgi:hypothetical protein